MQEKKIVIQHPDGLHARPAAVFAKKAGEFKSSVNILSAKGKTNAKSIMSMMALGLDKGAEITLMVEGEDEIPALQALEPLLMGAPQGGH